MSEEQTPTTAPWCRGGPSTSSMRWTPCVRSGRRRRAREAALTEFSRTFDRVVPDSFRVPADLLARCADELDPAVRRRSPGHPAPPRGRRSEADLAMASVEVADGATHRDQDRPREPRGLLYVPGGLAPLASSVLMNVPAQVAGVESLPSRRRPAPSSAAEHPSILGLCHLLGVTEVYAVGGAQAIAVFARRPGAVRPGRPGHRPGQHLRRGGQAPARRRRHRRRGGARPRSPCWPTTPPTRPSSPPT